jgi:hypothetical protein
MRRPGTSAEHRGVVSCANVFYSPSSQIEKEAAPKKGSAKRPISVADKIGSMATDIIDHDLLKTLTSKSGSGRKKINLSEIAMHTLKRLDAEFPTSTSEDILQVSGVLRPCLLSTDNDTRVVVQAFSADTRKTPASKTIYHIFYEKVLKVLCRVLCMYTRNM